MNWRLASEGRTTPSSDSEPLVVRAPMGNQFWLENTSGSSLDVKYYVNGQASPSLPQTADKPTVLDNSLAGTTGKLEIEVDGEKTTLIENIDSSLLSAPGDLRGGIIVGKPGEVAPTPSPKVHFDPTAPPLDSRILLPDNALGNTEVDVISVVPSMPNTQAITEEGIYSVDTLSDGQVFWVLESFMQNSIATSANEFSVAIGQTVRHGKELGSAGARSFLKEVLFQGKFAVKNISSWGGKAAIVFKGNHRSRSFLTAIMYGVKNNKMSYISSYAEVATELLNKNITGAYKAAATGSMPLKSGNFIGFAIATAFDIHAFMKDDDPEKNWGDLLGMLGVTFVKVWAAGFVGLLTAAGLLAFFGAPVLLVVGLGAVASIVAGVGLDYLDSYFGIKEGARKIGRGFVEIIDSLLSFSFDDLQRMVETWEQDFKSSLRENDPNGYCALFCSDPLNQLDAWMRGLGGRGLGGRF
ncbi:hypothetical protein K6Q96_24030 [Grimontia kaedaensis]|uniref:Uncharacterized protein n=1 Tax=Grimontia kaedaensis TaxID=2872157 RepID=A0ABY4X0K2_9GAMM|nr:hypothetical protein [Grimontia kaedaensis]USH04778.1 hypothetical protein K6Q96_24030 [Grimontia kaedaensis]